MPNPRIPRPGRTAEAVRAGRPGSIRSIARSRSRASRRPLELGRRAAPALLLALAGCGPCPGEPERGRPDLPIPTADPRAVAAAACPDWQWVGVILAPACPRIPGWEEEEILAAGERGSHGRRGGTSSARGRSADAADGAEPDPSERPPGRRYCRYTDRGQGTIATLLAEGSRQGLERLDRDCMAVVPLAAVAAEPDPEIRRWRALEQVFLARAGRAVDLAADVEPVRLVLVDTVANEATAGAPPWRAPWNSPHGVGLASMARRLTCPGNQADPAGAGCAALEVAAELALAYVSYDRFSAAGSVRDDVRGGFFGTLSDLAIAIDRAVDGADAARSVLNLSVGWNGYLFGGLEDDPETMAAPVAAVFDALDNVVGRGALVVAAAGNLAWGPVAEVDVGPMLPGGWAVHAAPQSPDGRPLLHAAGGLSHEAYAATPGYRLLANARFHAAPSLLAFADHAIVERHQGTGETATLTGSSVAALVVATSAAASRLYLASWSDAIGHVAAAAEPSEIGRDFCLPGDLGAPDDSAEHPRGWVPAPRCEPAGTARRVVLCAVARAACEAAGKNPCPACGPAAALPALPPEVDYGALGRFAAAPVVSLRGRQPLAPAEHGSCPPPAIQTELERSPLAGDERFFPGANPAAAVHRCPHWQYPSLGSMPWVDPAPESTPCTTCGFEPGSPATLYLEIDPLFWGRPLRWPVLVVGDRAYALDWDPAAHPRVVVEDVEYHDGEAVLLGFVLDEKLNAVDPLLRVR